MPQPRRAELLFLGKPNPRQTITAGRFCSFKHSDLYRCAMLRAIILEEENFIPGEKYHARKALRT